MLKKKKKAKKDPKACNIFWEGAREKGEDVI